MSFSEILVVVVVALLIMRPEDIPIVAKNIYKIREYVKNFTDNIFSSLNVETMNSDEDIEAINNYIQKITAFGVNYNGEYSLEKVKDEYNKLVKQAAKKQLANKDE